MNLFGDLATLPGSLLAKCLQREAHAHISSVTHAERPIAGEAAERLQEEFLDDVVEIPGEPMAEECSVPLRVELHVDADAPGGSRQRNRESSLVTPPAGANHGLDELRKGLGQRVKVSGVRVVFPVLSGTFQRSESFVDHHHLGIQRENCNRG